MIFILTINFIIINYKRAHWNNSKIKNYMNYTFDMH